MFRKFTPGERSDSPRVYFQAKRKKQKSSVSFRSVMYLRRKPTKKFRRLSNPEVLIHYNALYIKRTHEPCVPTIRL